jgi:peptidoglycan biosynthesis protein MviN/MurJ (putative lipid II flippase)
MNAQPDSATNAVMARIQEERRRDQFVRRVAKVAWGVTGVLVIILAVLTAAQIKTMMPVMQMPGGPGATVLVGLSLPFILVTGAVSVLGGTLATIGIFLRMRSASLEEIQLRLATLEELLTREGTPPGSR